MEETFPSWRYGPDGEAAIFQSADEVPKGWKDHPGKPKEPEVARRLPRPELMEALRQRGVQFSPNAGAGELAALLAASEPQPVEVDSNGKALGAREAAPHDPDEPGPNPLEPEPVINPSDDELVAANAADIIASINDETDLDALEAAERGREVPRKGVLAAIEKARK